MGKRNQQFTSCMYYIYYDDFDQIKSFFPKKSFLEIIVKMNSVWEKVDWRNSWALFLTDAIVQGCFYRNPQTGFKQDWTILTT